MLAHTLSHSLSHSLSLSLSLSLSFGRCCPLPNDFCENTRICSPDGDPGDHLTIVQLLLLLVSLLCSGACCFSARSKPLKNKKKNKQTIPAWLFPLLPQLGRRKHAHAAQGGQRRGHHGGALNLRWCSGGPAFRPFGKMDPSTQPGAIGLPNLKDTPEKTARIWDAKSLCLSFVKEDHYEAASLTMKKTGDNGE